MPKANFKKNYERLEEIVSELSKDNRDIDEAIKLFKEGIELYNKCEAELNASQKEVVKLLNEGNIEENYEEK